MALRLYLYELENVAKHAGFSDYKSLLEQWYKIDGVSLEELAERLHISQLRVRKHLARYGIPLRKRGGANNVKVVLTNALLKEIAKDGIPAVSTRLGVSEGRLYTRIQQWISEHPGVDVSTLE
jgi:DNA-binding transcriptional ArsR family regulator